jgi:uncharacterized protein YhaN
MPGARGKNARINEALRNYAEHNTQFKQAQVKPAAWADLFKQHQAAKKHLAELEEREREANRRLRRLSELRGVAPLIRSLDAAHDVLAELEDVRLLAENAATERAAAQAGLAAARLNAEAAEEAAERLRAQLKALVPDEAVLDAAGRIERLAANAESIDSLRTEIAETADEVADAQRVLAARAADIRPGAPVEEVLALAPAPSARAAIEETLRQFELAQQRLRQHLESARSLAFDADERALEALPAPEQLTALRAAQHEATRKESLIKRKDQLPAEIKALERSIAADVAAMGLTGEAALAEVRALLDSEIDAARSEFETADTELAALRKQLAQLKSAQSAAEARRDQLLAGGAVPTMADVRAVRDQRDASWLQLRGVNADGKAADAPLLDRFEAGMHEADRLVDDLARDTERATQLQGSLDELERLARDIAGIEHELAAIGERNAVRQQRWQAKLEAQHLPALAPAALREWQALLADAREKRETLQLRIDELEDARELERQLAGALYDAIDAVGMAPPSNASLSTLWSMATDIENEIERRERAQSTAAGQRAERERQARQFKVQQEDLEQQLSAATQAVSDRVYDALHLPQDAGAAAARARLDEFDALAEARAGMDAASARQLRAGNALDRLLGQGRELAQSLGDPVPGDLRLYVEQLEARLKQAKLAESERAVKLQGLEDAQERQHVEESKAQGHAATLERLCRAAGVESPEALPEAEEQSQRKRQAQLEADRARRDLAAASPRSMDDLRALLRDYDPERMDAEEEQASADLSTLEQQLRAARQAEESARRALDDVDSADTAAAARESMERDAAAVRLSMSPWMRSRLAHALLDEALKRFRERAQGPMLVAASRYFMQMTDGHFVKLVSDDSEAKPVLLAQRANGSQVRVEGLSEGTRDQLYLALRLAALEIRRDAGYDLPVVLDDVLMTSDDGRAALALRAIGEFSRGHQVILFTHHAHLLDVAERTVPGDMLQVVGL